MCEAPLSTFPLAKSNLNFCFCFLGEVAQVCTRFAKFGLSFVSQAFACSFATAPQLGTPQNELWPRHDSGKTWEQDNGKNLKQGQAKKSKIRSGKRVLKGPQSDLLLEGSASSLCAKNSLWDSWNFMKPWILWSVQSLSSSKAWLSKERPDFDMVLKLEDDLTNSKRRTESYRILQKTQKVQNWSLYLLYAWSMHGLCFVCFRSALERLKVKDTSEVPLPFLLEQAFLFQAAKLQKPFHLIPLVAVSAHPDIEHLSTSDFSVPLIPNSQNCANALSASGVDADKSAQHKGPAVRSPGQTLMSIGTLLWLIQYLTICFQFSFRAFWASKFAMFGEAGKNHWGFPFDCPNRRTGGTK